MSKAPNIKEIDIDLLSISQTNPRKISDERLQMLKDSIKQDEAFLQHNFIITDSNLVVISGNQRVLALKELGYKKAWVSIADKDTTSEELRRWVIKGNTHFGEFDELSLVNQYNKEELELMGVDTSTIELLDISNLSENLKGNSEEFDSEDINTSHKCPKCNYEW